MAMFVLLSSACAFIDKLLSAMRCSQSTVGSEKLLSFAQVFLDSRNVKNKHLTTNSDPCIVLRATCPPVITLVDSSSSSSVE